VTYRYATDHEHPFRQESNFFYLTGVNLPDFHLLIDLHTGVATLLAPKYTIDRTLWSGDNPNNDILKATYGADQVRYDEDLESLAAAALSAHPGAVVYAPVETDASTLPVSLASLLHADRAAVSRSLWETRLIKSQGEIELIRAANAISGEAHKALMKASFAGTHRSEHELYALFVYETARRGAAFQAYNPIVGGGCHGATLHYVRNRGPLPDDPRDLVLVDAGCEYFCYASDVTRTWPVGGKFKDEWKDIYEIVLEANKAVASAIRPGLPWEDMHLLADRVIAQGLIRLGILKGDLEEVLKARAQAVFFPHGLGHLLGLDVHDPGGYPVGVDRIPLPGLRYLRLRRPLAVGMVVTVEPGIYFVDGLIDPALADPTLSKFFDRDVLARYRARVGGVRIEDDVVVTESGCEDLTTVFVPKEIEEVEKWILG
ncbi:hypothetical protein M427DRAFT_99526, partial [Gonapodya prolifera JEL478]